MKDLLKTENVKKKFGGVIALNGVSVSVKKRTLTMIIGPNGSGKTTLINVISGIYKPDEGKVEYNGLDITGKPPHEIYKMGIVRTFQIPLLFTNLTVLENLLVAARINEGERFLNAIFKTKWLKREEELVEKAYRILELLSLDHLWNQPVFKLSGGQMKLIEIGRALMSDPRLVLMDEPIAGVNPKLAHEIFDHIVQLKNKLSLSFLIIEHRLDVALQYVNYVYAMHRGKVVAEGNPEEVLENPEVSKAYLGE
ncbi:MAG: ABC transporter ATP-binding protein [Thermoprotei archaeon]|nr:MAG: ABC transporter ATP-binding protein [Thermoprotei archaeon]